MAKVRLTGAVNGEFEVKFGLNGDVVVKTHKIEIEVDGNVYKVLVGEGDISDISAKTLEFIGNRIETLLKKNNTLIAVNGFGELFRYGYTGTMKDEKIKKAIFKTELGKLMLKAYERRDAASLEEVLSKNLWFVSESGIREFVSVKKALEKAKAKDIPAETAVKVKELLS